MQLAIFQVELTLNWPIEFVIAAHHINSGKLTHTNSPRG